MRAQKSQPESEAPLEGKDVEEATNILFDSYRNLCAQSAPLPLMSRLCTHARGARFCRRCYVYDCRDHGAGQPLPPSREATAMNIINTATVVASEPLLRSLTVDPESAQALPPMGISAPPDCGIKAPRKHEGSAACRPLGSAKAARRPPASEDTSLPSFLGDAAPEPCGDECHLAEHTASPVKQARWSMTEEVIFRKAKKMWPSCCRIAAVLRKPCREVRTAHPLHLEEVPTVRRAGVRAAGARPSPRGHAEVSATLQNGSPQGP